MHVINLKLMSNPLNWLTLALWLAAGAMVLAGSGLTQVPSKATTTTTPSGLT